MSLLEFLQDSAFSQWLSVSIVGFPWLIALHSVGMAVVVGLSLMVTLRLYGIIDGFRTDLVPRLLTLAVWGFALNLATGLLIFMTRGPEYLASGVFLAKMLLVVTSATILFWLRHHLVSRQAAGAVAVVDRPARALSLLASVTWFAAVIAGRLIAYLSELYR